MKAQLIISAFAIIASATSLDAQSLESQTKAIELITSTADRICSVVSDKGNSNSVDVKADISAQLSGLASKLASAGIKGTADITNESYQGPLRKDLATLIKDNSACKSHVFDALQTKLILPISPTQTSTRTEPPTKDFSAVGPEVNFGCEAGNTSDVAFVVPTGWKILNAYTDTPNTVGIKYATPKITSQDSHKVTASAYFHGRDREWTGNCPGGGHGRIRVYGTMVQE